MTRRGFTKTAPYKVFMSDEDIGTWAIDLLEIYHMTPRRRHDNTETRRDPAAAAHEMCAPRAPRAPRRAPRPAGWLR